MPDGRTIQSKFDAMKRLFSASPLDPGITALFKEINDLCQNEASAMQRLPLTSNTTARGKNYVLFLTIMEKSLGQSILIYITKASLQMQMAIPRWMCFGRMFLLKQLRISLPEI